MQTKKPLCNPKKKPAGGAEMEVLVAPLGGLRTGLQLQVCESVGVDVVPLANRRRPIAPVAAAL